MRNDGKMTKQPKIKLKEVDSDEGFKFASILFKEYVAQLGIDLSFQNFNEELKNISTTYHRPHGTLLLAYAGETLAGCAAIRKFENEVCELKRMYIRTEARGLGIGKLLLRKCISIGKELNYSAMRLDTLPSMATAIQLYEKEGFYEIEPYRFNPIIGTKYYEIKL